MSEEPGRDLIVHPAPGDLLSRAMAREAATPRHRAWPTVAAAAAALAIGLVGGWTARGERPAPVAEEAPTVVVAASLQPVSVRLALHDPDAESVTVAGSFNGWNPESVPLERAEDGTWHGQLRLPRGRYEYLFVVDGTSWVSDPTAPLTTPDDFGQVNAVLDV